MRGKGTSAVVMRRQLGITPAYAGKRRGGQEHCARPQDHPRVCGEKFQLFIELCFVLGSPPRMRGKGTSAVVMRRQLGITPAYAGKSRGLPLNRCRLLGSPPRMRGKGSKSMAKRTSMGITPAYAGKSQNQDEIKNWDGDHPRVCGEKKLQGNIVGDCPGSPPRMRGKGLKDLADEYKIGITPAYAGKRTRLSNRKSSDRDHPRVCGEKSEFTSGAWILMGSPPRMRGKVFFPKGNSKEIGITPAYAGKRAHPFTFSRHL